MANYCFNRMSEYSLFIAQAMAILPDVSSRSKFCKSEFILCVSLSCLQASILSLLELFFCQQVKHPTHCWSSATIGRRTGARKLKTRQINASSLLWLHNIPLLLSFEILHWIYKLLYLWNMVLQASSSFFCCLSPKYTLKWNRFYSLYSSSPPFSFLPFFLTLFSLKEKTEIWEETSDHTLCYGDMKGC